MARAALLLVKPRCLFQEVHKRFFCDAQPGAREVIAEIVEAAFNPADEGPNSLIVRKSTAAAN